LDIFSGLIDRFSKRVARETRPKTEPGANGGNPVDKSERARHVKAELRREQKDNDAGKQQKAEHGEQRQTETKEHDLGHAQPFFLPLDSKEFSAQPQGTQSGVYKPAEAGS
jgi:hypothetical protein